MNMNYATNFKPKVFFIPISPNSEGIDYYKLTIVHCSCYVHVKNERRKNLKTRCSVIEVFNVNYLVLFFFTDKIDISYSCTCLTNQTRNGHDYMNDVETHVITFTYLISVYANSRSLSDSVHNMFLLRSDKTMDTNSFHS